jgi:glycosyltransferase involved in cell wall biosynthesis
LKVSIVIAVYNEAPTVAELLRRVWMQPLPGLTKEIVVVESNSSDGSREIVADFVAAHEADSSSRIRAVYQDAPRGKGNAVRQGFAVATGDILLIQDADLEYEVSDYPDLLSPIVSGRTAFVLGSRHMGPERWNIRKFAHSSFKAAFMNLGGRLFHGLFNLVFSTRLTDPTSMYKVFRADCLEGLRLSSNRFDFDYELLGKLIRAGFAPLEVPVSYASRGFEQGKKIRIFRDPWTWIVAIFKYRFTPLGAVSRDAHTGEPGTDPVRTTDKAGQGVYRPKREYPARVASP